MTHGSILSCLQSETKDKPKHPYNKCFQCEDKPPRKGSLYCSNECQTKHAKFNVPVGILKVTVDKVILHDISSSLITLFSLIVSHQDYQPFWWHLLNLGYTKTTSFFVLKLGKAVEIKYNKITLLYSGMNWSILISKSMWLLVMLEFNRLFKIVILYF